MANSPAVLNRCLAAAIDLATREKHAHWNCTGPAFIGVHKLFDKLYDNASGYADLMAERARYLGVEAYGTALAASKSFLGAYTVGVAGTQVHLAAIDASLDKFYSATREGIKVALAEGDQATADVFIQVTEGAEHDCYLVRSHLM